MNSDITLLRQKTDLDGGWVSASILIFTLIVGLTLGFFTFNLAQAGFLRDTSQHGSDAAALAGAKEVRHEYLRRASRSFWTTRDWKQNMQPVACSSVGNAHAASLAAANESKIEKYCWNGYAGEVTVRTTSSSDELKARTAATAGYHASLYDCQMMLRPGVSWSGSRVLPLPSTPASFEFPGPYFPYLDCEGYKVPLKFGIYSDSPFPRFYVRDLADLEPLLEEKLVD